MIHINDLKKQFADKILFSELSLHIRRKDRIALVGENGTGKTTLLKMIHGLEYSDDGSIEKTGKTRTGYLPQFLTHNYKSGITLYQEISKVFEHIHKKAEKLTELEHKMGEIDYESLEYEKVMNHYGILQEELHNDGYYEIDSKIKEIVFGLGFTDKDLEKKCTEFSGGWQMRIALAKILIEQPEVLLLDEPTNHLDIEARNWLEDFIKNYYGAVVLVSHDRYFLDATINRVAEIYAGKLWVYSGNYTHFEKQREEYIQNIHKQAAEYENKVEKIEKFIDKFRYKATKASQVQSRVKMLDKMEKPIIPPKRKQIHFRFPKAPSSGLKVLEVKELSKEYPENLVFFDVNFTVEKGQRIAIMGKNGQGKTTLMKIIAGITKADTGEIHLGHNVTLNYYAQEPTEILSEEKTVYETLYNDADPSLTPDLRNILGAFLFSNDDVYKKVSVLSGGERSRLALARMLLKKANLLIMDEPTNHLDIYSKDILLDALKYFEGTIIFVSHDRYFVDNLANRILYLKEGECHNFNGTYEAFLSK